MIFRSPKVLFAVLMLAQSYAAQVKLAIVAASAELNPAADILTAQFSKLPQLHLLERVELERALRERALQAGRSSEALSAARFLGADALLLLNAGSVATNNGVHVRLVAVKRGAVLQSTHARWPVDDAENWAAVISSQCSPLLAKVTAPDERLIRLSLLNLRSPSTSPGAQLLDRELITLLRMRLSREPEILVLERQDLSAINIEKDLAADTEKLWTGAYLLDGTVNRDGVKPGTITLDLRLTQPGSQAGAIHIEGDSTNLVSFADLAAREVMKKLARISGATWRVEGEARAFLEEARWALRWQMLPEAKAAADAAWSLGLQDLDSAITRLLAYARTANQYNSRWQMAPFANEQYAWPSVAPQPSKIESLNEGLNFINEILRRYPEAVSNQASYLAMCEAIALTGHLLHCFYFRTESREGFESALAETRKLARQTSYALMTHSDVRQNHRNPPGLRSRKLTSSTFAPGRGLDEKRNAP